ncbi:hypothetical protein HID58_067490, partial [Brassica napus]
WLELLRIQRTWFEKPVLLDTWPRSCVVWFFMIKPYNRRCDVYSFGICCGRFIVVLFHPDLAFADVISAFVQNLRPVILRCCPTSLSSI